MEQVNYYLKYKEIIKEIEATSSKPKVLVQACCGPCSTAVLEELNQHFEPTLFYYNPNIYPLEEYEKRYEQFSHIPSSKVIKGEYNVNQFIDSISKIPNFALLKEGSKRCYYCYYFRLEETARKAKEEGYDFFTTTLSISPYKNVNWINEIGEEVMEKYNIPFLYSNFKKEEGYKKSIQLSKKYGLYRQEYCGCKYSLDEMNEILLSKQQKN